MNIRLLIIPLLLITLASCSEQRKIRRDHKKIVRFLEKRPHMVKSDTIIISDTVRIEGAAADTVIRNTITTDTVIIRDKQLVIRYYNSGDSIYITGECDTIVIVKNIPVEIHTVSPIKRVKYIPMFYRVCMWLFWILLAMAVISAIVSVKRGGYPPSLRKE